MAYQLKTHAEAPSAAPTHTTSQAIALLAAELEKGETAELWNNWATLQCRSGNTAKGLDGFLRAHTLAPGDRAIGMNLGLLLLSLARFGEAHSYLSPFSKTFSAEEKRLIQQLVARHQPAAAQAAPKYPDSSLTPGRRRNLLVVRAGDQSLHPGWLAGAESRNWDLLVHAFGNTCPWADEEGVEIVRAVAEDIEGPKMRAVHSLFESRKRFFLGYDYVCFADDDLQATAATWNQVFELCAQYELQYAQPALTHDSFMGHWTITMENRAFQLRYTNFVEVMCPVFSRSFLETCAPTFVENVSGYGLDLLWSSWVSSPQRIAILDACPVKHTRKTFSGHLYKMLAGKGVDPNRELIDLIQRWKLVPEAEQRPNQVVLPQAVTYGGVLEDGTRLMVGEGAGVALMRALLNGFPPEMAAEPMRVASTLMPLLQQSVHYGATQAAAAR
jgi:hypothetical protein